MGIFTAVADESSLTGQTSRSFCERPFKNDGMDSLSYIEAQQGLEVNLEYSIENGLKDPNLKNNKVPGWYSTISDIPRRRHIAIGLVVFFGVILIVSISSIVSKEDKSQLSSISTANTIQNNTVGSQLMSAKNDWVSSRFESADRGDGGGAGNAGFVNFQNNNAFLGEDVRIPPFSVLDPVRDLDMYGYDRPKNSSPSARLDPLIDNKTRALPTNAWYQNMLRLEMNEEPTKDHRVYTIPYVIDAAGDFSGIRAHATRLEATPSQVRLAIDEPYGLTLGAMTDLNRDSGVTVLDKGYTVHEVTDLGITLQWNSYMKTTLVRGSPYVTMIYDMSDRAVSDGVLPTMHWRLDTSELPIIDGNKEIDCRSEPVFTVERDLELAFYNSNQRWMVFFSQPVQLQCQNNPGSPTIFQVSEAESNNGDSFLIVRGALIVSSSNTANDDGMFEEKYASQLRASADVYPGQSTTVIHSFNDNSDSARISFDWDAHFMRTSNRNGVDQMVSRSANEMIMFALPHHREILAGKVSPTFCTTSLLGSVCLVEGNVWNMYENLPVVDFRAARHPDPRYIPILAEALVNDIGYQIPSNFQSGAADTYFSGKTIAKLARILLVAEEVKELCVSASLGESNGEYVAACDELELPGDEEIEDALDQLRQSVTVWVRTNPKAPFVYDNSWGGLVNCGCLYSGGECTNVVPECPAFTDQGLNFGNGFYNDHHFHYGYHIYAAAALAHFDSSWAIDHYEDVTLLVRDYANPSQEDAAFPVFRNKDWYRGHSWASGITEPMFGNIMNQESTSEAIMAYEAVALFGKTMTSIFQDAGDTNNMSVAKMMHKIGLTLTATEIRSTQKYWQVRQNVEDSEKIYPGAYTASVVGVLWETFAQFTTWFGNASYLIYGIQLLPLTPISEARDGLEWANEIYGPLAESCDGACVSEGWSIQVNAILATIGRVQEAVEGILSVPSTAYEHAGGNGHSKSNSLWYVSTRPAANTPSFQNEQEFESRSSDQETSESSSGDEEEFESRSSDQENFELASEDEEEFESRSSDQETSESSSGDEERFESRSSDQENSELTSEDEEEFESRSSDQENSELTSGDEDEDEFEFETSIDEEEEFETISQDEEDSERSTDEEESETIDIEEEDSNTTIGDEQESGIITEGGFLGDFVDGIFEDLIVEDDIVDENSNIEDSTSFNDNDLFDNILAGNEGSYNNNDNTYSDDKDVDNEETAAIGLTCFKPTECTDEVLDIDAEGYSCRDRIQYLMDVVEYPEFDACRQIAVDEYPTQCGFCQPNP